MGQKKKCLRKNPVTHNNRTTPEPGRAQSTASLIPSGSWVAPPTALVYKDTESNSHIGSTFLAAAPPRQFLQLGTRSIGV